MADKLETLEDVLRGFLNSGHVHMVIMRCNVEGIEKVCRNTANYIREHPELLDPTK